MSLETNTFPFFWDKNWFFFKTLWGKNSAGLSKMKFAGPKKNFASFFMEIYSSNLFRTLTESLAGFSKENLGVFVKTGFSLSKETFGKNFFLCKIYNLFFFWKIERKTFVWLSEKFQEVLKLLSTSPGEPFEKKSWKIFATFVDIFFDHYR